MLSVCSLLVCGHFCEASSLGQEPSPWLATHLPVQTSDTNNTFFSRIGFLGLGLMGSGIVSNLLKMGHTVTVWNRTAEKVSF